MVTLTSILQAPVQAILRPAVWLPKIKDFHCYKELWQCNQDNKAVIGAIIRALDLLKQEDTKGTFYDIHKVKEDYTFIRIFALTRAEWLDVMEFTVKNGTIEAYSFSSGLFPLIVPFIILINCLFFWVPFYDNKFNKDRIVAIRGLLGIDVITQEVP